MMLPFAITLDVDSDTPIPARSMFAAAMPYGDDDDTPMPFLNLTPIPLADGAELAAATAFACFIPTAETAGEDTDIAVAIFDSQDQAETDDDEDESAKL